jgi:hypothetical protein
MTFPDIDSEDLTSRLLTEQNPPDGAVDEGADADDFIPRAPHRIGKLTIALFGALLLTGGFLGGVLTQKHHDTGLTASRTGGGAATRTGGGQFAGLGGEGGGVGGSAARSASNGAGTGGSTGSTDTNGPAVIGQIVSVHGSTVIVQNLGGKRVTVHLGTDTTVSTKAKPTDLKAGQSVTVAGSTAADGSVTASTIAGQ